MYGPRYFAPLRYLVLFFKTLLLLSSKRPSLVYAQNPPVFCPLTCLIYCKLTGTPLLIDHHSIWRVKTLGKGPISKVIGFLEAVVARAARGNTAPHSLWGEMLVAMGAPGVLVVHDYVPRNPRARDDSLRHRFSSRPVIAIASHGGHPLERLEIEAAAVTGEQCLSLLISGPTEKLKKRAAQMPQSPNVKYLGFLKREDYETLKASADFALNITDEPYTLSHVIFEFVASSLPVISSRQSVVEDVFGDALLYADSTPEDVRAKVALLRDDHRLEGYRYAVRRKQAELESLHGVELAKLRELVAESVK